MCYYLFVYTKSNRLYQKDVEGYSGGQNSIQAESVEKAKKNDWKPEQVEGKIFTPYTSTMGSKDIKTTMIFTICF